MKRICARDNYSNTFTGGDSLLNPEFWKLAEYFREKGMKFHIMGFNTGSMRLYS